MKLRDQKSAVDDCLLVSPIEIGRNVWTATNCDDAPSIIGHGPRASSEERGLIVLSADQQANRERSRDVEQYVPRP